MARFGRAGITTLFCDIGGVLGTNGWDRRMRQRAAEVFGLDYDELNERHHLTFDTYETGKISLDTYLDRVVFYAPRSFTREQFREHMFAQSVPDLEAIVYFRTLARHYALRVGAISNEGRELAVYRTRKFGLHSLIQVFVYSSFVHFRKPDEDIYRVALDTAQADPEEAVYIDDRAMFAEVARGLGLHALHHTDLASTRLKLAELGLSLPEAKAA